MHTNSSTNIHISALFQLCSVGNDASGNPPQIITISNFEPLKLAKKKHYIPVQPASKIQKRTGAKKPQGRPFNNTLDARFILFHSVNEFVLSICSKDSLEMTQLFSNSPASPLKSNSIAIRSKRNESSSMLKTICFEKFKDDSNEVYSELCKIFNVQHLAFVKVIRNNKGKLIKCEILANAETSHFNINFMKKFVTYPRYKSNMKIYLIEGIFHQDICFYNDLRMLIWDFQNINLSNQKILVNNNIPKA